MNDIERNEMNRLLVTKYSFPKAHLVVEQCLASGRVNMDALERSGVSHRETQEVLSSMRYTFDAFRGG